MKTQTQPICLTDWEKFKKLERAASWARRYGYAVALAPFIGAVFVCVRYNVAHTDAIVGATLGWAILMAGVALLAYGRVLFIRCPSCGMNFGPANSCQWCGFPRYREGVKVQSPSNL